MTCVILTHIHMGIVTLQPPDLGSWWHGQTVEMSALSQSQILDSPTRTTALCAVPLRVAARAVALAPDSPGVDAAVGLVLPRLECSRDSDRDRLGAAAGLASPDTAAPGLGARDSARDARARSRSTRRTSAGPGRIGGWRSADSARGAAGAPPRRRSSAFSAGAGRSGRKSCPMSKRAPCCR